MFYSFHVSDLSFYTPWKYQKTRCFLMFSGGLERNQLNEMGYEKLLKKRCLYFSKILSV